MIAHDVANALGGARRAGSEWVASCPVPDHGRGRGDKNPSLNIRDGDDGKILVTCRSGCTQDAVVSALKNKGLWPSYGEKRHHTPTRPPPWTPICPIPKDAPKTPAHPRLGSPSTRWAYRDSAGDVAGLVCRFDRTDGKDVLPLIYAQDSQGHREWRWMGFPDPRPIYGLDRLTKFPDAPVVICEGEKAADAAQDLFPDHVAVTSQGGAKAASKTDWTVLRGRAVVIWPDADRPGQQYALDVAKLVRAAGATEVRVITPPEGVRESWDAADAIDDGWTPEQAMALLESAQTPTKTILKAVTIHDLLAAEFPPRENILAPWLPTQGLAMIFAKRGIGKTHLGLGVAYAVGSGGKFLRWQAPKPRRVLYVDGEMPVAAMQERWAALIKGTDKEPPAPEYLKTITPDLQDRGIPDIGTEEGQEAIEQHLDGVELVIIDNLSTLARSGKENEAESWLPIQEWSLGLRRRGIAVLFIHHAGKGGQQRGTSRREDVLDTVINLKHPSDYSPEDGCRVEIHFEKARGLYGDDLKPFEAKLETRNGETLWTTRDLDDCIMERVVELHKLGLKQRDIANELDIGLGTVNRRLKEAREVGLIGQAA